MSISATDYQVDRAYRLILRHLRGAGARRGDAVPKQQELRRSMNIGNDAITLAMRRLVADGVLDRRPKTGTRVLDLGRAVLDQHTVLVVTVAQESMSREPFYMHLLRELDGALRRCLGVQVRIEMHAHRNQPVKGQAGEWSVADSESLIADGGIDAVICSLETHPAAVQLLAGAGIPCLHVGAWERARDGVVIDQVPVVRDACRMLRNRGCASPTLVVSGPQDGGIAKHRHWQAYLDSAAELAFRPLPPLYFGAVSLAAGRELGRHLLAQPRSERPDGLIIMNDIVASGLTDVLRDQDTYHPDIAVQANVPGTLIFGRPVVRFDVRIDRLAQHVTTMLEQRWTEPDVMATTHWFVPQMSHERSREVDSYAEPVVAV